MRHLFCLSAFLFLCLPAMAQDVVLRGESDDLRYAECTLQIKQSPTRGTEYHLEFLGTPETRNYRFLRASLYTRSHRETVDGVRIRVRANVDGDTVSNKTTQRQRQYGANLDQALRLTSGEVHPTDAYLTYDNTSLYEEQQFQCQVQGPGGALRCNLEFLMAFGRALTGVPARYNYEGNVACRNLQLN